MKLHELFPEISLNPASAKDIKQWILQLAVEGKLTKKWREENPNTESAFKLIEKMSLELKELIKSKQVKKEKELEPIKEVVIGIPETWAPVRLGNIGDWGAGATPLRSVSTYYDGEINWYKSGELNYGIIDYPSEEKITEEALKKCSLRMNKPGDVLIAMYGATIGKTGLLQTYGTTNQAVCGCAPYSGITSSFLILLLNGFKNVFIDQGEGGAQPNISRVKIRNQVVNLPPLEEQHAIVSIVESLFKEVDELAAQAKQRIELKRSYAVAALNRLCEADTATEWQQIAKVFPEIFNDKQTIKTLRETILQLAVQGKLTAKWRSSRASLPTYQTAHELLAQIKAEKAQLIKEKKIKAEKPLPPIEADEIPFELPEGWVWCRMGDIGLFDRGKSKHRPRNDYRLFDEGKYPLVQTGDISKAKFNNGKIISHKSSYNEFGLSQSKIWPKGTLCITIAANIAETGFLTYDACFPDSVVGFQSLIGDSLVYYVEFFIATAKADLEKYAPSTAQKNINLGILYELKFPLPPLAEQQIIFEKVNALMGLCDELEKEVEGREKILQNI